MRESFDWVTKKKNTSEPAWMLEKIRKLIVKQCGFFRKRGEKLKVERPQDEVHP